MWKHRQSQKERLLCSQCGKQAPSLEEQTNSKERTSPTRRAEQYNRKYHSCSPFFELNLPRLQSEIACDRPETTKLIVFSPIREVVWQQPQETFVDNFKLVITNKIPNTVNTQTTHTPKPRHKNDVEVKMSSFKGFLFKFPNRYGTIPRKLNRN